MMMSRIAKRISSLAIVSLFFLGSATAQEKTYSLDTKTDLTLAGLIVGSSALDYFLYQNLEPLSVTEVEALDILDIPRFDRGAARNNNASLASLSDINEYLAVGLPLILFADPQVRKEAKEVGTIYLQVLGLNTTLTQLVKLTTKRIRPQAYNSEIAIEAKTNRSNRRSFYSGHVSHTAAMAVLTAKVHSDMFPDSKWNAWIWGMASALPVYTGYLRYESGKHFPSDILAGLLSGGAIGYLIPHLHKSNSGLLTNIHVVPMPSGLSIGYVRSF